MSRPVRVVRLVPELDFGGVESRIILQSENTDASRVELRVCAFHKDGRAAERIRAAGIPVDILNVSPGVRNPRATAALVRYLDRVQPDVVHATIAEGMFHGGLAGYAAGVPKVIVEECGMPSRSTTGRLFMSTVYRLATDIVSVSRGVQRVLHQEEWAPTAKSRVIYNCGKPEYFDPPPPSAGLRAERDKSAQTADGASARGFRFVTVGRLVEVKNQKTLIDAFAGVVASHPDAELWLAGDGPLADVLAAQVESLGLQDSVTLLGFRSDVRDLLDSSDAFVLCSLNEGCSIAMIESMATGIPVLGSDVSGIAEVMERLGSEARLVAPTDTAGWTTAMQALIELDPDERAAYGQLGRKVAFEHFSPTAYMETLANLYEEVHQATLVRRTLAGLRRRGTHVLTSLVGAR